MFSVLPMASHVTPGNSPSSKATPIRRSLQRNSSQSSIESTASDSQLLLRNNKYGRLKRQLSSSSVRSAQSDRTDMQPRGNSQVKRDIYRIDLTDTPRSPGSTHKLPISESSPVKEKTSIEVVGWNTLIADIMLSFLRHFENQFQVLGLLFGV